MPALLPSCAVLYEEGCRFLDGNKRKKLLCSENHWNFRHHHTTREKHMKCNESVNTEYNNIAVITSICDDDIHTSIPKSETLRALTTMRIVNCLKCWLLAVGTHSVLLIETIFNMASWNQIWRKLRHHFDTFKPHCPKKLFDIKNELHPVIKIYINSKTKCLIEVPRMNDVHGELKRINKFSAYNIPCVPIHSENTALCDDTFEVLCYQASKLIEEGYNFLRVKASEIIAFVATNSSQVVQPGIPPHLPIAYGMCGHSFPMETMRNMMNDICNDLKQRNTSVLCEVYDGQFHKLNVRSESGDPLTRIQQ